MASMGFNLIVFLVLAFAGLTVVASLEGKGPSWARSIPETVDRALEPYGINVFSIPRILSVIPEVGPDGSLAVRWTLNKDAEEKLKDSPDYKVEFLYKKYPGDDFKNLKLACSAYTIGTQHFPAMPGFDCRVSDDKSAVIGSSCVMSDGKTVCKGAAAGDYTVKVSFKQKGKDKFTGEQQAAYGLYDEAYLEFLDKPLQGCADDFGNCAVVECKRKLIEKTFSPVLLPDINRIKKEVSEKFTAEHPGRSCGKYEDGIFKYSHECSPEELNELNNLTVRVRLLEAALLDTNNGEFSDSDVVKKEDDYALHHDRIQSWITEAVQLAGSCAYAYSGELNLGTIKPPVGAGQVLKKKYGWTGVGAFTQNDRIKQEALRVIDEEITPVMVGLKAEAFDDAHVALSWTVPVGKGIMKKGNYGIRHFHTRWPGTISKDNQRVEMPGSPLGMNGAAPDGALVTSNATATGQPMGEHELEFTAYTKEGELLKFSTHATGLFDDAYIETFKGGIDKCVTAAGLKDADLHTCDVYAEKRETMKAFATPSGKDKTAMVQKAVDVESPGSSCKIETVSEKGDIFIPHHALNNCNPEELDRIYKNYLIISGTPEAYSCLTPYETSDVCSVKRQVRDTLGNKLLGWEEITEKKVAVPEDLLISKIASKISGDNSIAVEWELTPEGLDVLKSGGGYEIEHSMLSGPAPNKVIGVAGSPHKLAAKDDTGKPITKFTTNPAQPAGLHKIQVKIISQEGRELIRHGTLTGFFDDAYIETFKGGVDKCMTKGGDAPSIKCDVYAQKRASLKEASVSYGSYVEGAWVKAGVSPACKYEGDTGKIHIGGYILNGCAPEELDRIWKIFVQAVPAITDADDYDCAKPVDKYKFGSVNPAYNVCVVKRQLVSTLANLKWNDERVKKGWEKSV